MRVSGPEKMNIILIDDSAPSVDEASPRLKFFLSNKTADTKLRHTTKRSQENSMLSNKC